MVAQARVPYGSRGTAAVNRSTLMGTSCVQTIIGPHGLPPRLDVAVAPALLAESARCPDTTWLRLYRPAATVAFTRLDIVRAGERRASAAGAAAVAHGFNPVLRAPGGRAVAYHDGSLCVEVIGPAQVPGVDPGRRFQEFADLFVAALREVGVPASVGEVPGESCPGRYSVRAGRWVKLAGTAQRVVRHGWIVAGALVVRNSAAIRAVTGEVYDVLGLPFDPATVGSVESFAPTVDVDELVAAIRRRFPGGDRHVEASCPQRLLDLARRWAAQYPDPWSRAACVTGTSGSAGHHDRAEGARCR